MYYFCNTNNFTMETTITRKQTSFRLRADLINKLRIEAKKENRSLNNYVESVLMAALDHTPNKTTIKAIQEAESGKDLETLDLSNFKEYIASL